MMTRGTFIIPSRLAPCGAVLLTLTLVAMASTASSQELKRSSGNDPPRVRRAAPADAAAVAADLARFLEAQPFVFAVFTQDDVRRAADAAKPLTPTLRHPKYE
jgi:hypothetical protein